MLLKPAKLGLRKTLATSFLMAKIIVPVTFVVVALEKLALLESVAHYCSPFLQYLGLPGEASLPLLLGFFVNIYAAMGAIVVLELTQHEITILAIMILTSHSLFMEAPVLSFTGLSPVRSILLRIGAGLLFGYLLNLYYVFTGGV